MISTNLYKSDLTDADLTGADLNVANLREVNLSRATISGVCLRNANMIETVLKEATLINCTIYGMSAWGMTGEPRKQENLIITPEDVPTVAVDDLQVAQFVYLLLNHESLRKVLNCHKKVFNDGKKVLSCHNLLSDYHFLVGCFLGLFS